MATAIAKIIRDNRRCPKNLQKEFYEKEFYINVQKLLKKHNINYYSTYSVMKASVVEWFNRTLKNDMWKQFTHNGNYKWIDLLPHLVSEYNVRKHRTIGMRLIDVTSIIANKFVNTMYSSVKTITLPRYKVDDSEWSLRKVTRQIGPRRYLEIDLESSKYRKLIPWLIFWKIIAKNRSLEDSSCIASLIPMYI